MIEKLADEESEAERRFNETLGRLVNTPPKPHIKKSLSESPKPLKKRGGPKTAPKSAE